MFSILAVSRHLSVEELMPRHEQSVSGEMKIAPGSVSLYLCRSFQVELTSDADIRLANPVHLLTEQDSFDVTASRLWW